MVMCLCKFSSVRFMSKFHFHIQCSWLSGTGTLSFTQLKKQFIFISRALNMNQGVFPQGNPMKIQAPHSLTFLSPPNDLALILNLNLNYSHL